MKTCWKKWLKAAAVRAVKTVAQTAVATIGTSAAMNQVDWFMVVSASALAGVLPCWHPTKEKSHFRCFFDFKCR